MDKKIFLSHSSKNADIASELCAFLEKNGKKCFIAPRDIRFGMEYAEEIVNGIDESEAMILILSKESNESAHVLREVERAVSKGIPVIVYRIEEVELSKSLEYFLMTNQWLDAKKMSDYKNILTCVEQVIEKTEAQSLSSVSESNVNKGNFAKLTKSSSLVTGLTVAVIVTLLIVIIIIMPKGNKDDEKSDKVINNHNQTVEKDNEANIKETDNDKETIENDTTEGNTGTLSSVKVGDTINFGKYYNEEIEWRVLNISEDEKKAVLITKDIICMKPYDVAEGGKYNNGDADYYMPGTEADTNQELQIDLRGNSDWSKSNIRTWLNSSDEVVKYLDQAPEESATSEIENGYNNEPGFLNQFSKAELDVIVETENVTKGNKISGKKEIITKDKVFLLSMEQFELFEEAGISVYAKPTQAAIDNNESNWYLNELDAYNIKEFYWWLREPVSEWSSKCYMVSNGYYDDVILLDNNNVGLEGFGIRPAVTVDIDKLKKVAS